MRDSSTQTHDITHLEACFPDKRNITTANTAFPVGVGLRHIPDRARLHSVSAGHRWLNSIRKNNQGTDLQSLQEVADYRCYGMPPELNEVDSQVYRIIQRKAFIGNVKQEELDMLSGSSRSILDPEGHYLRCARWLSEWPAEVHADLRSGAFLATAIHYRCGRAHFRRRRRRTSGVYQSSKS